MRRLFVALFFAAAAMSGALAEDERNVTIVNGTGYGIKFLGVNTPDDDDWSDNELSTTLASGGNVYVKFNTEDEGCVWNIKIDWADDNSSVRLDGVDLCTISDITLHYDAATGQATAIRRVMLDEKGLAALSSPEAPPR